MITADPSQQTTPTPPVDNSQAAPSTPTVVVQTTDGSPSQTQNPVTQLPADQTGRTVGWDTNKPLDHQTYHNIVEVLRNSPPGPDEVDKTLPKAPQPQAAPAPVPAPATPEVVPPVVAVPAPVTPVADPIINLDLEDDATGLVAPAPGDAQKPSRVHFRPGSELDATVLRISKATGKSITDPATIAAAKASLGIVDAAPATVPAPTGAPAADVMPTSISEVDAQMENLRTQRLEAQNSFRFEDADKLERQIDSLKDHKYTLREQTQHQAGIEQHRHDTIWTESATKAANMYPAAADPQSALTKLAREKQQIAQQNGDPRYSDPRSALYFVQEAAYDLGIAAVVVAPAAPAPVAPPTAPLSVSQPSGHPPLSAIISGGNPQSPTNRPSTETETVKSIKTPQDYEALLASNTGVIHHQPGAYAH